MQPTVAIIVNQTTNTNNEPVIPEHITVTRLPMVIIFCGVSMLLSILIAWCIHKCKDKNNAKCNGKINPKKRNSKQEMSRHSHLRSISTNMEDLQNIEPAKPVQSYTDEESAPENDANTPNSGNQMVVILHPFGSNTAHDLTANKNSHKHKNERRPITKTAITQIQQTEKLDKNTCIEKNENKITVHLNPQISHNHSKEKSDTENYSFSTKL